MDYFNPLPPHGGRHTLTPFQSDRRIFQSTPSAWRETALTSYRIHSENLFQSTPSAWRETVENLECIIIASHFNPLPPHGGRPHNYPNNIAYNCISIHSLRMEGDKTKTGRRSMTRNFNPLPPHGGRRRPRQITSSSYIFQSTPSAWRETETGAVSPIDNIISIHSLRMEGDIDCLSRFLPGKDFNPLPPHGGRRSCYESDTAHCTFQSTPSAWRETDRLTPIAVRTDISIHSLRMEGDSTSHVFFQPFSISIHSLRIEGDVATSNVYFVNILFQSTPSAWRETPSPSNNPCNI